MPVLLATFGIFALVTAHCREVLGGEYKTGRMASCRTDDPMYRCGNVVVCYAETTCMQKYFVCQCSNGL